jgi:signal transduction histidine kinase/ligand-binding sensor domain-containing protein
MTLIFAPARKPAHLSARRLPLSLCCMLAFFCTASAAFAQYHLDSWTTDNGLPQNSIQAIVQGDDGYLWLATFDGLARFDGLNFTIFNKSNSPGFDSNRLTALYEDSRDDLWIGTEASGVVLFRQGRFSAYTRQQGLPYSQVVGISGDARGNVWVMSGYKVVRWSIRRFVNVANSFPSDLSYASYVIERRGRGGFWGVDNSALFHFESGRLEHWTRRDGLPSLDVRSVAQDEHGALWVITRDAGVVRIEGGRVVKVYKYGPGLPTAWSWFISGPKMQLLTKDRTGELWIIDLDSWSRHLLAAQAPAGLVNPERRVLVEGVEGNLWIGTEGGGLYRARKQIVTVYSEKQGLRDHNIYPIFQDQTGAMWIGAWPDSVTRIMDGKVTNYTERLVTALYADRTGPLWVATGAGLHILQGRRFTTPRATEGIFSRLREVSVIYQDHEGAMWFGGEDGLARYQNGVSTFYSAKDGMEAGDIKAIIEDEKGNLWIGGYGGVSRFKDGTFKNYHEQDGLPSNTVRALYEDRDGVLWIGTYDGGLGRLKDGKFTRYTTRDGLFNNGVFQILEDSRGYLWMSCNHGIYRVWKQELNDFAAGKRSTITSVAYGKSDGMLSVECNGGPAPAGIKARDGKLWFPTQDGVAVIDPAAVPINLRPPPVVIESCLVDRVPRPVDRAVRIEPVHDNFEIHYTALSFIDSGQIKFKYKLDGLDRGWVDAGTRRTAYYSHVAPGRYIFRVIAANSDGVWNTAGQSLPIILLPAFYQTWWFLTLGSLLAAGAVVLAWQYRVSQLKRANALQQAFSRQLIASQEAERKRIAAELHDSLGQHLVVIKNLALISLNDGIPNAAGRPQLEEISAEASHALTEVRTISHNLRPYQLERLGLTKAIKAILKKASGVTSIAFTAEIDDIDDVLPKDSEISFYRIVQECVNNVVKHSQATAARVTIRGSQGPLLLTVRDNGRGLTGRATGSDGAQGGFGLIGITERAQLLGGKSSIHSEPGAGTAISIEIPRGDNGHGR